MSEEPRLKKPATRSCSLYYKDEKSERFFNIVLEDKTITITQGPYGSEGKSETRTLPGTVQAPGTKNAEREFERIVKNRRDEGYVDMELRIDPTKADEGDPDVIPLHSFVSIRTDDDIRENAKMFIGKRVIDYNPKKNAQTKIDCVYRFQWDHYNDANSDHVLQDMESFLDGPEAENTRGIVIGLWPVERSDQSPNKVINLLVSRAGRLPNLAAIYLGDITAEQNEMSWIVQSDVSPLLEAFPKLQLLRTRGGGDLKLSNPKHAALRGLIIETGGMDASIARAVCTSDFPNLEHLELWLGTDEYGCSTTVEDLQPILSGKLFPKLKYLGLRNCHFADDLATVVANCPIVERIETLDLSLGTLTDEGANALLSLPKDGTLKNVNLHHHFLSKAMMERLGDQPIRFDTSNQQDDEDDWRFVAVGE